MWRRQDKWAHSSLFLPFDFHCCAVPGKHERRERAREKRWGHWACDLKHTPRCAPTPTHNKGRREMGALSICTFLRNLHMHAHTPSIHHIRRRVGLCERLMRCFLAWIQIWRKQSRRTLEPVLCLQLDTPSSSINTWITFLLLVCHQSSVGDRRAIKRFSSESV